MDEDLDSRSSNVSDPHIQTTAIHSFQFTNPSSILVHTMRVWKPETEKMEESPKKRKALEDKAARKKARAEEKARIMAELPTVDENGISYTKQQLRRMRKRVARGLNPIETPAEEHERRVREAQLKREEEAELAGLILSTKKEEEPLEREEEASEESANEQQQDQRVDTPSDQEEDPPRRCISTKKKRNKQVPADYICSACKNAIEPAHWIYDCPNKKTVRGANQKSKKLRGLNDPPENKVFVSGLPFETTVASVKALFSSNSGTTPSFVKLVKFKDSDRCRGQAYVSFSTSSDTNKAHQLDGMLIANTSKSQSRKKDLKLTVSKVLNRSATAKQTSK